MMMNAMRSITFVWQVLLYLLLVVLIPCRKSLAFPVIQTNCFTGSFRYHGFPLLQAVSDLQDLSSKPMKDDDEDDEHVDDVGAESVEEETSFQISKSKWKKKRFLMIKDVNAAVSRKQAKAAAKAEEMVRRMWTLYERTGEPNFRPDLQCYNLWIHAVAKSDHRQTEKKNTTRDNQLPVGKRAELILEEMRERGIAPNVVSYTSVADAYANQARQGDINAPAEAERVLFDLLERSEYTPNLQITEVTQSAILNAWAQQGTWEGAERAQQILDRLEAVTNPGSRSSKNNTMLTRLRPKAHSYAAVIHAWANSGGGAEAARNAHAILNRLLRHNNNNAVDDVRPDTVIFNAVITAWANSGDAQSGTKALELLTQMRELSNQNSDCQPDVVTYNAVLSALSRSGHVKAAVKAENVLKDMIVARKEDPESNPAPNVISYNTVLDAWSKSMLEGAQDRAEALLKFMSSTDQKELAPDVYSYSSVLNAIAKSKLPRKALRAKKLLEHMLNQSPKIKQSQLTPIPFNAVINAAAFSAVGTCDEEKREALQVAVATFSLMRKLNVSPDTISYGNLLKAFANLMPKAQARFDMAVQIFRNCCEEGMVEDLVWNEVRRCVPFRLLTERMGIQVDHSPIQLLDLPQNWRRNSRAKPRKRRTTKQPPEQVQDFSAAATSTQDENGASKSKPLRRVQDFSAAATSTQDENGASKSKPLRRQVVISEVSYQSGRDL